MSDDPLQPRTAERLARAAHAAQELSDALWEALRDELADPRPERVAELSERLVAVAGTVSTLARADGERTAESAPPEAAEPEFPRAPAPTAPARERPARMAVLVDELGADGEVDAYSARAGRRPPASLEDLR